jgi:DNA-binding transcriptional ArsR family regulator
MVQYEKGNGLDAAFAALADPTRRGILERLGEGEATITELAQPFGMSLTGIKKHVQVLEQAGLLSTEKQGRTRHCRLGPRRLEDVRQWIDAYRSALEERLDRFAEMLAKDESQDAKSAEKRDREGELERGKQP